MKRRCIACWSSGTGRPGWRGCTGALCAGRPMADRIRAADLLTKARMLYDDSATGLARDSRGAWRCGFVSGAEWMRRALTQLRHRPPAGSTRAFNRLGTIKYGFASIAALACVAAAAWLRQPLVAV